MENRSRKRGRTKAAYPLKALGSYLRQLRESAGLRRGQVAERMKYENLSKGCYRLSEWEKGEDFPRGDRVELLAGALGQSGGDLARRVQAALAEIEDLESRRSRLDWASAGVVVHERRIVVAHLQLLMENLPRIMERQGWRDIRVAQAHCGLIPTGGRRLTLGALLTLWDKDLFTVRCQKCGHRGLLFSGGGSALTGSGSVVGICTADGSELVGRLWPANQSIGHLVGPALMEARQLPEPGSTRWSLRQLLADLGIACEDIIITTPNGDELARYEHRRGMLRDTSDTVLTSLSFDDDAVPTAEPPSHWRRDDLEIGVAPLRPWIAHEAWMEDEHGRPVACTSGVMPPPAAAWLAGWLDDGGHEGQPSAPVEDDSTTTNNGGERDPS